GPTPPGTAASRSGPRPACRRAPAPRRCRPPGRRGACPSRWTARRSRRWRRTSATARSRR
ncbi:hypothetical protein, partial [Promicromonospora kroppenstedtii]|uniref:hypothetical protein n=1 Tax=Promicromonospora kroppenstedtii TaxID=440482 RepID=UPI003CCB9908